MSVHRYETGKGVRYRVRFRDEAGKMKSRSFLKKSDAARFERDTLAALERGTYSDPRAGRQTVAEFAEYWLSDRTSSRRPSTQRRYELIVRAEIVPRWGDWRISAVKPQHIQEWVADMSRRLAPSSVEAYYRAATTMFYKAVEWDVIAKSPCGKKRITLPTKEREINDFVVLEPEEVAAIGDAMPDRYRALFWLQATTGMRTSEVVGLTLDRVNFLRRTVRVDRQLVDVRAGVPVFGKPKTPTSTRTLDMTQMVTALLSEHIRVHGVRDDGLLFATEFGTPVSRATWSRVFRKAAAKAHVEARPHDLRHFFVSAQIREGFDVKRIQRWCGHQSARVTLDIYGHLFGADERGCDAVMERIFGGDVPLGFHRAAGQG